LQLPEDLLSVNSRNISGTAALHVAAAYNAMKLLEYLITQVCASVASIPPY
jgi:ankyrin repeat protein